MCEHTHVCMCQKAAYKYLFLLGSTSVQDLEHRVKLHVTLSLFWNYFETDWVHMGGDGSGL